MRGIDGAIGIDGCRHHFAECIDDIAFAIHAKAAGPAHIDRLGGHTGRLLLRAVHRPPAVDAQLLTIGRKVDDRSGDDVGFLNDLRERLPHEFDRRLAGLFIDQHGVGEGLGAILTADDMHRIVRDQAL